MEDFISQLITVIKEEIRSNSPLPSHQSNSNTLINRTRQLINDSATSAINNFNPSPSSSVPNHPNRLTGVKKLKDEGKKESCLSLQHLK